MIVKTPNTVTRALKLEVVELADDQRRPLYGLAESLREVANYIWRQWECWHTERDTGTALRDLLARDRAWRAAAAADRGKRPKWDVKPWPKEFANELYGKLTRRFPQLNVRVLTLTMNTLRQTITTKQSNAVALKWWIAILLDLDSRGCCRRPQPISFDSANAKVLPAGEDGRVWFEARCDRIERQGKRGTSTVIRAALKTGGKRSAYARPAARIADGELPLRGGKLIYDDRKRKWFVAITYDAPVADHAALDADRVAILRPGKRNSWTVRCGGRTWRLGGRGHHVAYRRRATILQRWSRQHGYTFAPRRKGRSRRRALVPLFKLTNAWNNFTSSANRLLVAAVVELCKQQSAGRVVLVGGHDERLLATAGKLPDRREGSGWPWYQVQTFLQQTCQREGIEVELRPFCGGKFRRNRPAGQELQRIG